MQEIILPTVAGMAKDGMPYTGFLYAGLMIDAQGQPRTVEFNCRLGDPEAQVILMRLKSDLFEVLMQATDGTLDQVELQWDRRVALGVVMAAHGYPAAPRKGDAITGLPRAATPSCRSSTPAPRWTTAALLTSGGRVLCVTALGESVRAGAAARAARRCDGIRFDGAQWRNDIGHRAIKPCRPALTAPPPPIPLPAVDTAPVARLPAAACRPASSARSQADGRQGLPQRRAGSARPAAGSKATACRSWSKRAACWSAAAATSAT